MEKSAGKEYQKKEGNFSLVHGFFLGFNGFIEANSNIEGGTIPVKLVGDRGCGISKRCPSKEISC